MTAQEFKRRLRGHELLLGTCITHASPLWACLPAELGFDFAFIDAEHFPFSEADIAWLCRTYVGTGVVPFVRIASTDPVLARRAVYWGAWVIVAPYMERSSEVQDLVGAVKFEPLRGKMLEEESSGDGLPRGTRKYLESRNRDLSVFINVESRPAVENLEELIEVPGVDGVLIGPHDLTISLGIPERYDDPLFLDYVGRIVRAAKSRGLCVGIHAWWDVQQEKKWLEEGISLLVHSSDFMAARGRLREELRFLRGHG